MKDNVQKMNIQPELPGIKKEIPPMTDDFSKERERLQRRMVRQKMHFIWKVAQTGNLNNLTDEEKEIAHIILEHEEYNDHFSKAGDIADYEYDPESDVNIFMHIGIHTAVGNQLKQKEPNETYEFYNATKEKGVSHHEIVHLIGLIFMPLIFDTLKNLKPFDGARYKYLLGKYKDMEPEKLEALIEEEFKDFNGDNADLS